MMSAPGGAEGVSDAIGALAIASCELTEYFSKNIDEFNLREAARTEQYEADAAALEEEMAAQGSELNAKEQEHIEERQALADEIAALDGTHCFTKSKVKLDIGGRRFTTSRATLKTERHSLLAAMLSGRYDLIPDPQDGSYFIDRDGQQFHHILNYMRGPDNFECPTDKTVLEVLKEDAVHYRLVGFGKVIEAALAVASNATRRPAGTPQHDRNGQHMSMTESTWTDADAARSRDPHRPSAGPYGATR